MLGTFKMRRIIDIFIFGACLASMFQVGYSTTSTFFDEVSKELPVSDCDMIVVSSSPIQGEITITSFIDMAACYYQSKDDMTCHLFRDWKNGKELILLHKLEIDVQHLE